MEETVAEGDEHRVDHGVQRWGDPGGVGEYGERGEGVEAREAQDITEEFEGERIDQGIERDKGLKFEMSRGPGKSRRRGSKGFWASRSA